MLCDGICGRKTQDGTQSFPTRYDTVTNCLMQARGARGQGGQAIVDRTFDDIALSDQVL